MSADRTVVLLNPPARELHIRDLYCSITSKANYYWPPIDLLLQSGFLSQAFNVVVIDAVAENLSTARTLDRLAAAAPRAVLSMIGSSSLEEDVRFLAALKRRVPCLLAVTGDVCVDPVPWLLREQPWLDALLTDFTLPGLLEHLLGRSGRDPLPGLTFRRADGQISTAVPSADGEFDVPVPRHDLFPLDRYRLPFVWQYPFTSVLTNYACPFTCSYCIQNRNVLSHKGRALEGFEKELRFLKDMGVRELYFRDPLFESSHARVRDVCGLLKRYGFAWSCNCRVNTVSDSLLAAMRAAGCHCVAFGFETADEQILKKHEKPVTLEQAKNAIRLCRKYGMQIVGYFILGLPGERVEAIENTIRFAVDSGIDFASFSAPSPDYGTKLREESVRLGMIPNDYRRFNRSHVHTVLSPTVDERSLGRLMSRAVRSFYLRPMHVLRILSRVRSPRQLWEIFVGGVAIMRNYLSPRGKARTAHAPERAGSEP